MEKISFNREWKYTRRGRDGTEIVSLPHDAMLAEERSDLNPSGKNTGWYAGGDYIYEKEFTAPAEWAGKRVFIEFEGVYHNATVWINGEEACFHPYGYTGFYIDMTDRLLLGKRNTVRVRAINSDQPNSRWYSGAGIYRPVYVYVLPEKHILPEGGIRVRTTDYAARKVRVQIATNAPGTVKADILDGDKVIASCEEDTEGKAEMLFVLSDAKLWSCDSPRLYTCRVRFGEDEQSTTFGIRQVECSAKKGFCINGERVILRGACIHHDNGILGACAYDYAEERKIRKLLSAGYNAIRSAHNPCSKAMLDACDRLGMLVMDEYVDMWYIHKNKFDYANYMEKEWKNDLLAMVNKDYNHPSVVLYSTGNEVAETAQKRGIKLCGDMTEFLHSVDDRPVTCGINVFFNLLSSIGFGIYTDDKAEKSAREKKPKKKKAVGSEFFNNLAGLFGATTMKIGATMPGVNAKTKDAFANLDVAGYNYGILRYKGDMRRYPDRVILGSETFCADARRFYVMAKKHPAIIGDFVWAGIDYLGEVGIGAWEYDDQAAEFSGGAGWISAGSGRLDLNGREWAEAGYTRAAFELDPVRLGVVRPDRAFAPHSPSAWRLSNAMESWAWDKCDGCKTKIEVYSAGKTVELYINGAKIGRKGTGKDGRATFKARYASGTVTAVAYDEKGKELGRKTLKSGGKETKLTLLPEEAQVFAENGLCYVRLQYTDKEGTVKPLARGEIRVQVEGGKLLGLGSACSYNPTGFLTDTTDVYYGEAMAVILPEGKGTVTVRATSPHGAAETSIRCI